MDRPNYVEESLETNNIYSTTRSTYNYNDYDYDAYYGDGSHLTTLSENETSKGFQQAHLVDSDPDLNHVWPIINKSESGLHGDGDDPKPTKFAPDWPSQKCSWFAVLHDDPR